MPTTPPPSSQGSTVSFNGEPIGSLVRWRTIPGSAKFTDVTSQASQIVGSGDSARVIAEVDCTAIEPGGADVTMRGVPPWVLEDIGTRGGLSVTSAGGNVSLEAFLESFEASGSVGQFLEGTARFRFTGAST